MKRFQEPACPQCNEPIVAVVAGMKQGIEVVWKCHHTRTYPSLNEFLIERRDVEPKPSWLDKAISFARRRATSHPG